MDKKTLKKELQLIRNIINSVTGLEDEDEALLQYAYEAVNNLIQSLADQPANQLDDINVADIPAQQQEPFAWLYIDSWGDLKLSQIMPPPVGAFPVYTSPPASKPWVGLTDEHPLMVFAKECVLGAYQETELADAAKRAIEAANGITGDNT